MSEPFHVGSGSVISTPELVYPSCQDNQSYADTHSDEVLEHAGGTYVGLAS